MNKIRQSIPKVENEPTFYKRPFEGERLIEFEPTTKEELREIIKESGIKTSMEDPIPSRILQSVTDVVILVLEKLINKSLSEGSMEGVKWSVIDPLLKKAGLDFDVKKNYRPVNNIVFFSKLVERVVSK